MSIFNVTNSAFDGTIRVFVGPDRVVFDVHRVMVCELSPFFNKAINGPFREAEKKEVELPDDEPHIFTGVMNWIYRKTFNPDLYTISWLDLAKFWIIADKLDIPPLQHQAIHAIFQKHVRKVVEEGPLRQCRGIANISPVTVDYIYENTRVHASLRRALVELFVDSVAVNQLQERIADFPAEFLADVLGATWAQNMKDVPHNTITEGSVNATEFNTTYAPTTVEEPLNPVRVEIHVPIQCDGPGCATQPENITGIRYRCSVCADRDFCSNCKNSQIEGHDISHPLIELKTRIPFHVNVYCDGPLCANKAGKFCIQGTRFKCNECADCDYCENCKLAPTICSQKNHVLTPIDNESLPVFVPSLKDDLGLREYSRRRNAGICVNCTGSDHNTNSCIAPLRDVAHPDPDE
jgi:hypothetical protein